MLGNTAEPIQVALASPATWWALNPRNSPRLFLTTDAGQHWRPVPLPAGHFAGQVSAADARHAWVLADTHTSGPFLLVTNNGGRTWHLPSLG